MLPVFIIWLIRQYRQAGSRRQFIHIVSQKIKSSLPRIAGIALAVILLILAVRVKAQTRELTYQIQRDSDVVGTIQFTETITPGFAQLKMESHTSAKVLFITYASSAREEALYHNGVLFHSSIYRSRNGREKANKQYQAINNQYLVQSGQKVEVTLDYPITYNMLSLYSAEPVNVQKVYSDYSSGSLK